MTDKIYLYPKTSCPCEAVSDKYTMPQGTETNLSVNSCKVPRFFRHFNALEFSSKVEPVNKEGISLINPQAYSSKLAPNYNKVQCSFSSEPSFVNADPRLFDTMRADYITLDRPPVDGDVRLKDMYKKQNTSYKTGVDLPYNKIEDGNVMYYTDESREDAFYRPLFSETAKAENILFKDPMGAMKPNYNRIAMVNTENPATVPKTYPYGLSFIQDTQSHREDLLSLQMRKMNQERWMPRWS